MMSARANRVCGECLSAQRAIVSNCSASHLMSWPSSVHQSVALAAHRAQVARKAGIGLDLAAQPRDLDVDRTLVHAATYAPAQGFAAQHLAEPRRERTQQRDLGVGQR